MQNIGSGFEKSWVSYKKYRVGATTYIFFKVSTLEKYQVDLRNLMSGCRFIGQQSTIVLLHFHCSTNIVNFYICSVRSLLCTFLGSSSKFIRQAELFYHLNNCLSFYGHFGARSMPQQLLAANKVIVYQSRGELSS